MTFFYLPLTIIGVIILVFLSFQTYFFIVGFLINAFIVFKKENHSLANSLTLLLSIGLIGYVILSFLIQFNHSNILFGIWIIFTAYIGMFYTFTFIYFIANVVGRFHRIKLNQDYIIVLGAGLIDDKITPLLKKRVDVALKFALKQFKKTKKYPKLIMSGGQGADEKRSEASAMKEYAIAMGYDENFIILESEATTTYENMVFAKKLINQLDNNKSNIIFATSSYHVFRAGQYAKKAGLKIRGLGAKTAWYFVFNAFLREEIAIIYKYKKSVIFLFSIVIIVVFFLDDILNFFIK
jgi:uncharacterized SAM-binding protein YcdF (DUF218 family)